MNIQYWTTRKGKVLAIKDMSTLHIQKCISMLKKNITLRKDFCDIVNVVSNLPIGNPQENQLEAKENDRILGDANIKSKFTIQAFESELLKRGEVHNPAYKDPILH